jgi:hypothetical protein
MSKSKKRRVRDRRATQKAAQQDASQATPDSPGGRGEPAVEQPFLSAVQENKIIASMLAGDWPSGAEEKATAVDTTKRNMASEDGRVSNGAVSNLIKMEAQKMKHQQTAAGGEVVNHLHSGSVTVEERRAYFVWLGETLRDFPEAKERLGKALEERVRLNSSEN